MGWTKTDNNEEMEDIRNMFRQIGEMITTVDRKIDKNAKEMKCLRLENENLKRNIREQEERLEMTEREIRRINIIIQGSRKRRPRRNKRKSAKGLEKNRGRSGQREHGNSISEQNWHLRNKEKKTNFNKIENKAM
jgi:hypothetical protein